jgi:hypothetical protein
VTLSSLLLLCTPFVQPQTTEPWPALDRAQWDSFAYEILPDEGHADFVVSGQVRLSRADGHGRLLFCLSDEESYYAIDLAAAAVRLLRVESGLVLPIGSQATSGLRGGKWFEILLRREGDRIEVFLDGVAVAVAADGSYPGGKIAFGSLRESVAFRELVEQDTAPAYLEDDFMRVEGETGEWETVRGKWQVQAIGSPVRSNNAFNFTSGPATKGALALCGEWFWHDYEVSASCQPHGEPTVGLYAHYASPGEHILFRVGRPEPGQPTAAELVRVRKGKSDVLASRPTELAPDQWYRLGLRVEGSQLVGIVDGHPVVEAVADTAPCGRAGLYARGREGATFDDFVVRQSGTVAVGAPDAGMWHAVGGSWQTLAEGESPRLRGIASSAAKLLYGDPVTDDACVSAIATRPKAGEVGLVAGWEDETNYDVLTYGGAPTQLRLLRITDGQTTVLAERPVAEPLDTVQLELALRGYAIVGSATGLEELHAPQNGARRGHVGLLVRDGDATFDAVQVRRLPPLPEVAHFEGTFQQEVSMADWAAENSDWIALATTQAEAQDVRWHRAPAYGDQELSVSLSQPPPGPVSVLMAAEEPGAAPGYLFTITPGAEGSARLARSGSDVSAAKLPDIAAEGIRAVSLRKQGNLLVAALNHQPLITFHDPQPLPGLHSGWSAPAGVADPAQTTFRAENVLSYSFRRAPSDWWSAAGEWKVTNRWDCEPRWTFFIGQGQPIACLWNKREFGPDVTLDFYAATRFDSTKGYQYSYAADLNCTIAADGLDLTSGYSFMFGGWDNQYTRLLRGNEVLAETSEHVIPRSSSIHRRWFNLRVQKAGQRIRCWMDGTQLFDVTDPEPLAGGRIALWTYSNGMAVARVRIASNQVRPGPLAPPEAAPRCPYEEPPSGAADG